MVRTLVFCPPNVHIDWRVYALSCYTDAPKVNIYNGNTNCQGTAPYNQLLSTVCLHDQTDDDHSLLPYIDPIKGRHLSSVLKTPLVDPVTVATTLDTTAKDTMQDALSTSSNVLPTSIILPVQLSKLQQNSKTTISTQGVCMYPSFPDDDTSSDTLSAGAIVGIVIGTIIGLIVLLYAGYTAYERYYGYGKYFSLGIIFTISLV